jgi:hypothetical protein
MPSGRYRPIKIARYEKMTEQGISELHRQHHQEQSKYTYFLLAAAASAVAFAIQKTSGAKLSLSMIPLGFATLSWGLSFYCGCRNLLWVQVTVYANYSLLQLKSGIHPNQPADPKECQIAEQGVRLAIEENIESAASHGKWQFRLLILGAVFFLAWHILDMVLRTFAT